ncbi:MAG: NADH-quinone oxidoreductase subunit I [Candidatus Eisenbacteria bacterium]|nr:NADH-quinone oxidoreductase subunit I [Candidatus Eisenbacteria bacterium]
MPGIRTVGRPMNIKEKWYLFEIAKGMAVSIRHLVSNILHQERMPTLQYPEEKRVLPERFRGRHRLTKRDDGTPKCVACYCCQTACPADCISIEAGERGDAAEKVAVRFDINILRCVFCGLCVEACPVDAIRMDTGKYELTSDSRKKLIYDIDTLLND